MHMRFRGKVVHGFRIMFEVGLLDAFPTLESHLLTDLHVLDSLLHFHVKRKLQSDTSIYVCSSKKEETTVSRYHPKECKMFSGSITVSAALYLRYRHCWSDGAILVHEFAHAVHDKLIPGGFLCEIIEKVNVLSLSRATILIGSYLKSTGFQSGHGEWSVPIRMRASDRRHKV